MIKKNTTFKAIISYLYYDLFKKRIMSIFSDRIFVIIDYFIFSGDIVNFKKPRNFTEKIQWLKVYGNLDRLSKYVDKFVVRSFVSKVVGDRYLIPVVGLYNNFDEINFEYLPNKFVLKCTHGSGYVYVCNDKGKINFKTLRNTVNNWMNEDFYKKNREPQYKYDNPRILIENYLEDESGSLTDYKLFCFNGKPLFIFIVRDRYNDIKYDFRDLKWNKLKINYHKYPNTDLNIEVPRQLKTMIDISSKLSTNFDFVRVDLYLVNGKIYFGELTFTPDNGMCKIDPPEVNEYLGGLIDLDQHGRKILSLPDDRI